MGQDISGQTCDTGRSGAGAIAVLALGGTIAMTRGAGPGVTPQLGAADLVAAVPELAAFPVEAVSFRQLPSARISFADLEALADEIRARCAGGAQGIVVTQGTDTIEETAFALDLLLDVPCPVVVTGAMRNPTLAGSDGPANLLAAVQVAASGAAAGAGVLVVMNDEIHAARAVRKSHTTSTATFVSGATGPLGWLSEGRVVLLNRPALRAQLALAPARREVHVPLLTVALGFETGVLAAVLDAGIDGLVLAAMGGGHVPAEAAGMLGAAAARIPVVLGSRSLGGEVLRQTYGYPGGEIDLIGRGLIGSGWLDPLKARILTVLILRAGGGRAEVAAAMAAFRSS